MYKAQNEKEASNTVRNDQPEDMSKKAEETGYNNNCEGQVSDRRQSVHHLPDFQKSGKDNCEPEDFNAGHERSRDVMSSLAEESKK